MLQEGLSALGILILKRVEDQTGSHLTFERVGSIRVEYLPDQMKASERLRSMRGSLANTLAHQLDPPKVRRALHGYNNEIFHEYNASLWPCQTIDVV